MRRLRTALPVVLMLAILGGAGSTQGFAEDKHTGSVPYLPLPLGIATCIDFDGSCPPTPQDGDAYSAVLELAVGSDPNSADSTPEYGLFDEQMLSDTCRDGMDNDLDGKVDTGDSGCRVTCHSFVAGNSCTDQDHDGWLKYIEEALGSDPKDRLSTPEVAALPALFDVCTDGIDNDRDGLIDGEELDCDFGSCVDFDAATECDPF